MDWRCKKNSSLFLLSAKIQPLFFSPQTLVTLENGKLIQKHSGDGGDFIIEREISDGQLIAVRSSVL